jgi:hypothetical protein
MYQNNKIRSYYKRIGQASLLSLNMRTCLVFICICTFLPIALHAQTTQSFSVTGSNIFKVPAGVTQFSVQCWGAGGAGGGATGNPAAGGGGVGGSYAKKIFTGFALDSFSLFVGKGGSGSIGNGAHGGSSWFQDSSILKALGGRGGEVASSNNSNGAGGAVYSSGNFGDSVYYGGAGALASFSFYGGGGGGSAGSTSNGNAASGITGGTAVSNGSAGANGAFGSANGGSATSYGGGGGGARAQTNTDRSGGNGANGLVKISYNCPNYLIDSIYVRQICSDTGALVFLFADAAALPVGTYVVTYNLGAPNAMSSVTATMNITTAGRGNFRTALLGAGGNTTITITSLNSGGANGCTSVISTRNTATFMVTLSPNPSIKFVQNSADTVSVIQVCSYNGSGSQNDMQIISGNHGGSSVIQWQLSYDGGLTWSSAPGPSSLTSMYVLDPLYTNFESNPGTYYFRVILVNGNCTGISNKIRLTVTGNTNVTPGTIGDHQYFCVTGDPAPIVSVISPIGGNNNFNFKWQMSTDSLNFSNINGTDAISYDPPVVTQTTYFRRVIFSGGCRKFSNVVRVKVSLASPPSPSSVSGPALICTNSTGVLYTAQESVDADTYTWTVPNGWSINSGQGNDSVYLTTGITSGNIGVMASNACGSSIYNYFLVTLTSGSTAASITAGSRICQGDSANISIQITGGAPPYQVVYTAGADTNTVSNYISGTTIRVLPLSTTTYKLLNVYNYGGCSGQGLASGTTIRMASNRTWVGNADSLWENAGNWCGGVPSATDSIFIASGTTYQPMIRNQSVTIKNMQLDSGAIVRVAGQWMILTGNISGDGKLDVREGNLEFKGTSSPQVIDGTRLLGKSVRKLRLSNAQGISLSASGDSVCVSELLDFGSSNVWLQTNSKLTMLSRNNLTANIGDMTSDGLYTGNRITGDVTVEKYIPNQPKAWWLLSVPTVGSTFKSSWQEGNTTLGNTRPGYGTIMTSHLAGATTNLGFDIYTSSGTTLKVYNSSNATWDAVANTNSQMANNKGYMIFIRGDRSVTAYNQPATSTILRTTGTLYTPMDNPPAPVDISVGRFESVANPYACSIDFTKLTKTGGVQNVFYLWDPRLTMSQTSAYGLGGYQTVIRENDNSVMIIPGGGSMSANNRIIPSGQSFFVRAMGHPGQIIFTESCKTLETTTASREVSSIIPKLRSNFSVITSSGPVLLDGWGICLDDQYANLIDSMDVLKIGNSTSENIGIIKQGQRITYERRSRVQSSDTTQLNIAQLKRLSYRFDFNPSNLNGQNLQLFLNDKFTNTSTPIPTDSNSSYIFTVTTDANSWAADRFYIVFNPLAVLPVKIKSINAKRMTDQKIKVDWEVEMTEDLSHFELERSFNGKDFVKIANIVKSSAGVVKYYYDDNQASAENNFYRLKTIENNGFGYYSSVVKVNAIQKHNSIIVSPNPVINKTIHCHFEQCKPGWYRIELYGSDGKLIQHEKTYLNDGQTLKTITLNKTVSAGIYQIRITDDQGFVCQISIQVL